MVMRTHLCSKVDKSLIGRRVSLCGWVKSRRDHGGVIFIDLRDRSGVVQTVAATAQGAEMFSIAESVRHECVLRVVGDVQQRPQIGKKIESPSDEIEVVIAELEILSTASGLTVSPDDKSLHEETRLSHRIIDLRGERMQSNMRKRYAMSKAARDWFSSHDFVEIETPMLARATPEGARDFLTPSRLQEGSFYALPQSPQLFKQMLMASGFERYFQITRCFRDEDLRADRQLEFTQIDVETSFMTKDEIMQEMEEMACLAFAAAGVTLPSGFLRMTFSDAMLKYGCDRPDLRNPLVLTELGEVMKKTDFSVFSEPAFSEDGRVAGLRLPGGCEMSRSEIDKLTKFVSQYGAKGLAYIKVKDRDDLEKGIVSPIVKFLSPEILSEVLELTGAESGDIIFFGAGREDIVCASLSALRDKLGSDYKLLKDKWCPLWVTDFPLFERDYESEKWTPRHHPFTSPCDGHEKLLLTEPKKVIAKTYDMILNGVEIGGGGIRNHKVETQMKVFEAMGISPEVARKEFDFLLSALESGAPPHGGIAFGLDRMAAMACGEESIRDVIAFPKTQRGQCLLTGAPTKIEPKQLSELHIDVKKTL